MERENDKFILDENNVAIPVDLLTWASWLEKAGDRRRVADTSITSDIRVSTIFMGLDHSWGRGKPLIFETMVFGGVLDNEMDRYSTWEEAEAGHASMVKRVNETLNGNEKESAEELG